MAKPKLGLKGLCYAPLTADTASTLTYGAVVALTDAIQGAKISVNGNDIYSYADDHMVDTDFVFDSCEVELNLRDLPLETQGIWMGQTVAAGVLTAKSTDSPIELALGFYRTKSDGKKQYFWFTKGKASAPSIDAKTRDNKPDYQYDTIKLTFMPRTHDDTWMQWADEDGSGYVAATGTNWFTVDQLTGDSVSALTLTPVPADHATGVLLASNLTWTYNNAIDITDVTAFNFGLIDDEGDVVAGALTYDTDHKVITFNPTDPLITSKAYDAYAMGDVTDVYGQVLAAGNTWTKFTTE